MTTKSKPWPPFTLHHLCPSTEKRSNLKKSCYSWLTNLQTCPTHTTAIVETQKITYRHPDTIVLNPWPLGTVYKGMDIECTALTNPKAPIKTPRSKPSRGREKRTFDKKSENKKKGKILKSRHLDQYPKTKTQARNIQKQKPKSKDQTEI